MRGAMAKKRKRASGAGVSPRTLEPSAPRERFKNVGGTVALWALALAIVGIGWAVDTGADAAFDAPKRLVCLFFVALAAAGALAFLRIPNRIPSAAGRSARWALGLLAAALGLAVFSAIFSPRRPLAIDALRAVMLFALLLPIGASRTFEKGKGRLLAVFLSVAAVNAVVSILQARGLYHPFQLRTTGGREATAAYVGNVGYLALTLALAAVAALAILFASRRPLVRVAAGLCLLLFLTSLLFNRNLTAISSLFAGAAVYMVARFGRRAIPYAGGVVLVLVVAVALPPMRTRVRQVRRAALAGNWNAVTTYRFGAWKAAVRMAKDRPILGYGPGTFGAEFVSHRLEAEIAAKRRYINPLRTSSYMESHCDYLQPLAEVGIPAGLAAVGAAALLLLGLAGVVWRRDSTDRREAELLLAFLVVGAVGALTWFPMQRPVTALPLLLAAGRSWKLAARRDAASPLETDASGSPPRWQPALGIAAVVLLAGAVWPEFSRYASERRLFGATAGLRFVLAQPSQVPDRDGALSQIASLASDSAPALPGDPRPWLVAGGAYLVKGEPDRALDLYKKALSCGERAEIDLNMARALDGLGRSEPAHAAYLRTGWISPALVSAMPPEIAGRLKEELKKLRRALRMGELSAPPPLPE
jgi:O-antigen ligase